MHLVMMAAAKRQYPKPEMIHPAPITAMRPDTVHMMKLAPFAAQCAPMMKQASIHIPRDVLRQFRQRHPRRHIMQQTKIQKP